MRGPEGEYIRHIDSEKPPVQEFEKGLGFRAEEAVIDFINERIPGCTARISTYEEDAGSQQIGSGKQVDIVVYSGGEAVMSLQISTTTRTSVKSSKFQQLMNKPFVRLPEITSKDTAVPKALVILDPEDVQEFLHDKDFDSHPNLVRDIVGDIRNSLKFDLLMTKNPQEQEKINLLLALVEDVGGTVH